MTPFPTAIIPHNTIIPTILMLLQAIIMYQASLCVTYFYRRSKRRLVAGRETKLGIIFMAILDALRLPRFCCCYCFYRCCYYFYSSYYYLILSLLFLLFLSASVSIIIICIVNVLLSLLSLSSLPAYHYHSITVIIIIIITPTTFETRFE